MLIAFYREDAPGSLAEDTAWIDQDPFVAAGVCARVTVKPVRKALP